MSDEEIREPEEDTEGQGHRKPKLDGDDTEGMQSKKK